MELNAIFEVHQNNGNKINAMETAATEALDETNP